MTVSAGILRELLVEAGVEPSTAEAVQPALPLLRQGVDSLDYPAFCLAVEKRFGLTIDDRASLSLRTLDDFIAYINERVDGESGQAESIARIKRNWREIEPGQEYTVELLRPGDGPGVAQLFYSVYGDRYPVADYYDPETIERFNAEGKLLTVVARLSSGTVAGAGAYYQSSPPNKALFEFGQFIVAPEYRNSLMVAKISKEMDRYSRTMTQAQGFFGEAVCTHMVTQKFVKRQGYAECGLEVALMPAGAYEKEGAGAQRVSCLLGARVDRDQRKPLHLPECYREEMEFILGGFTLDREIRFSGMDAPLAAQSSLDLRTFDFAQVERMQVLAVGADFPERVERLDEAAKRRGLAVVQVFVNTGEPGVAFAVEALRARGFFLGGFVPLWFGPDGLLMQKLYVEPEFDAINLYADRSKQILAFIRADWDRSRSLA
ncbi:MAG: acyl carrier protein [Desulfovibrio sp.]|nr:acyl carrier protein [Desulfovibrio sp.]MBI4958447.1 acyl carrier protein [Desulfovibrio sp.]